MTLHNLETQWLSPHDAYSTDELSALLQRIADSGELGRSRVYANLLTYLIECSTKQTPPKEVEIAIDVLGRGTDFDATKDSVVRVYVHQLRKKLERYYARHEKDAAYRLAIPKGQYTVIALPASGQVTRRPQSVTRNELWRRALAVAVVLGLAANLIYFASRDLLINPATTIVNGAATHSLWHDILHDNTPLMVVMGDYYIFGELDEAGNIKRMVREFNINSKADLDNVLAGDPELGWHYTDLDLTYLPEGSAAALNNVLPVLQGSDKRINIKMMSELDVRDLKTHHVIYIGYISGMGGLERLWFAASGLRLGENYDELISNASGRSYVSNAGLPAPNKALLDYGLLARFPSTDNNQVIVIAGMRDAGLMHTAQASARESELSAVDIALSKHGAAGPSFEVLFEVHGLGRTNFDGEIVYAKTMDPDAIWRGNENAFSRVDP